MDQKEFDELLKRYLQSDVSEEECALIDRWYRAIERTSSGLTRTEKAVIKKRLQSALRAHKEKTGATAQRSGDGGHAFMPWMSLGLRMAASITVILAAAGVFVSIFFSRDKTDVVFGTRENDWSRMENTSSYAQAVTLGDGSEITLDPGAVLEYPQDFNALSREVRLKKGSAFFKVSRDEQCPFYVYSYDVVTRVLGTSFRIHSDQKGHVTVDVETGSVSVSARLPEVSDAKTPEIILTPNQRAAYDPTHNKIVRSLVEKPEVVLPPEEVRSMTFDRAPIATIFHAVEKAYHVRIRFDDEKFSSCVLTTYLIPDEDLYTRLRIICEAIGATYREEDGDVIISGKGCF